MWTNERKVGIREYHITAETFWKWHKDIENRNVVEFVVERKHKTRNSGSIQKCIFQLEVSGMCLFYVEEGENVTHIVDAREMLAQMDDVAHGKVCLNFHWSLIKSYGFGMKEKWYCH